MSRNESVWDVFLVIVSDLSGLHLVEELVQLYFTACEKPQRLLCHENWRCKHWPVFDSMECRFGDLCFLLHDLLNWFAQWCNFWFNKKPSASSVLLTDVRLHGFSSSWSWKAPANTVFPQTLMVYRLGKTWKHDTNHHWTFWHLYKPTKKMSFKCFMKWFA